MSETLYTQDDFSEGVAVHLDTLAYELRAVLGVDLFAGLNTAGDPPMDSEFTVCVCGSRDLTAAELDALGLAIADHAGEPAVQFSAGTSTGQTQYLATARKRGECHAEGTGRLCYWDGAIWRHVDDNQAAKD